MKIVQRIVEDVDGYYICQEGGEFWDLRGRSYPTRRAAVMDLLYYIRSGQDTETTHYRQPSGRLVRVRPDHVGQSR